MTVHELIVWLLILAAFALFCDRMMRITQSPACPFCGGKTDHKTDCPVNK